MRRGVRIGFVVLGAAMAVYGGASLTGGWLGTPPWQEGWVAIATVRDEPSPQCGAYDVRVYPMPRTDREWMSGGVVAVGLALVAVGAWPRRRAEVEA